MGITGENRYRPVFLALALCAIFLCGWIVLIGSQNPPPDRRIANVALSRTGRWLAAGTGRGRITVWDQRHPDAPMQIAFLRGSLNDLQFSPDERVLAIASADLAVYTPGASSGPRLLRSDHGNYGSARFSPDGQTLLVITGAGLIQKIGVHSGTLQLSVCCSSIYGEAVFTPDGQMIANAGHWPGLWDAVSGRLAGRLTANREFYTFRPIAFDTGRNTILMGSQDGRVYVWDLSNRRVIAVSPAQPAYVDTLAISTNGWVTFAGFGEALQLWHPETGQRRSLPEARPTSNLVPGPDGASVLFGTAEGAIEFWDLRMAQRLRVITIPEAPG